MKTKFLLILIFFAHLFHGISAKAQTFLNYPTPYPVLETVVSDGGLIYSIMDLASEDSVYVLKENEWQDIIIVTAGSSLAFSPGSMLLVGGAEKDNTSLLFYNSDGLVEASYPESLYNGDCLYGENTASSLIKKSPSGNAFVFVRTTGVGRPNPGPAGTYMIKVTEQDTTIQCLNAPYLSQVAIENDNRMYLLQMGKLTLFNQGVATPFGQEISDTSNFNNIQFAQNTLYTTVVNHGPILTYDGADWSSISVPESGSFEVDSKGNIWVYSTGAFDGVYFYNGQSWIHYTSADGLLNDRVHSIYIDDFDNAWIGTETGISVASGVVLGRAKENKKNEIHIWPNPAKDQIQISDYKNYSKFKIYSSEGIVVREGILKEQLDISGLSAGIYHLTLTGNQKEYYSTKFVKM